MDDLGQILKRRQDPCIPEASIKAVLARCRDSKDQRAYAIVSKQTEKIIDGCVVVEYEDLAAPNARIGKLELAPRGAGESCKQLVAHL